MTTSERYERYWSSSAPPPEADPLTPARRALLWGRIARETQPVVRLLDCGAGEGGLVADARDRGLDACGIEVSHAAIDRGRQRYPGIDLRRHSVEERPWPVDSGTFDVVVAFEVIEHLLEPRALLECARTALRPGGALALSTPFHGRAKAVAISLVAFDRHFDPDGDHVRFFTDRSLRRLLLETGFAKIEIAHLGRFRPLWANTWAWARAA